MKAQKQTFEGINAFNLDMTARTHVPDIIGKFYEKIVARILGFLFCKFYKK